MGDYSADPAVRLAQLENEVRELEDRLEVYATNDDGTKTYLGIGDMDGIGCRDETIKLLDKNVETLRVARTELESKLDDVVPRSRLNAVENELAALEQKHANVVHNAGTEIKRLEFRLDAAEKTSVQAAKEAHSAIERAIELESRLDAALKDLDEASPMRACARCGKHERTHRMVWEEGDEMECLPCNERCNAQERAEILAGREAAPTPAPLLDGLLPQGEPSDPSASEDGAVRESSHPKTCGWPDCGCKHYLDCDLLPACPACRRRVFVGQIHSCSVVVERQEPRCLSTLDGWPCHLRLGHEGAHHYQHPGQLTKVFSV